MIKVKLGQPFNHDNSNCDKSDCDNSNCDKTQIMIKLKFSLNSKCDNYYGKEQHDNSTIWWEILFGAAFFNLGMFVFILLPKNVEFMLEEMTNKAKAFSAELLELN